MSPRRARECVGGTGYPLSGKAQTGENGSHGPHHRSRTGAGLAGMSERTRRPVVTLVAHGRAGQVHYREGDHAHAFGWDDQVLRDVARTSIEASFAEPSLKQELLGRLARSGGR